MKAKAQLIAGGLFEERTKIALKLISSFFDEKVNLDNPPVDVLVIKSDNSVGINQIRTLKKFFSLRPYQAKVKIGLILEAEKLTLPAQNSLLKTLEEPPANSFIILLAGQSTSLLPTIISRAKIIHLPAKSQIQLSEEKMKQLSKTLSYLLTLGVGERIKLSLTIVKDKHQALVLIENLLFLWRQFMLSKTEVKSNGPQFIEKLTLEQIEKALKNTEQIRKMLKANANFHLAIENLFLSYPHLS
jgi:DNA polymerase III delta prime subunit